MNKLLVIAALLAVSACSKPAPAPEAEASAAPEAAATNIAADGKPSVGTYKVTTAGGEVVMVEVKADGTYSTSADGKVVETGKWEQKSPELYCYTKDEKDAVQQCDEEKVENGVYTSKNPKGEVSIVERVES
jgi:hypothetical protein